MTTRLKDLLFQDRIWKMEEELMELSEEEISEEEYAVALIELHDGIEGLEEVERKYGHV
jgi:hypothetical protein